MKRNRIPQIQRLVNRISKLESKLIPLAPKPYGGRNPYYYCGGCKKSMVQISIDDGVHVKGCPVVGIMKEIAHYQKLLESP